ncbi:MAG TPA: Arc family DNA-binding protein [Chthoniobacterales bacterium]|jgi:hypothetical protein|nr:Arc family DNA-binding protein [Chthoniobacterales bacterium]
MGRMARKPSDPVKLNLRFTEALRSRLEKQATKNNRSLNEEIIRRLEESFKREDLEDFAERLAEKLGSVVTVKIGDVITKHGLPRGGDEK